MKLHQFEMTVFLMGQPVIATINYVDEPCYRWEAVNDGDYEERLDMTGLSHADIYDGKRTFEAPAWLTAIMRGSDEVSRCIADHKKHRREMAKRLRAEVQDAV